ncbi:MAG: hypothetical protein ACD_41C00122G0008, partial [uncultured bacterium]
MDQEVGVNVWVLRCCPGDRVGRNLAEAVIHLRDP